MKSLILLRLQGIKLLFRVAEKTHIRYRIKKKKRKNVFYWLIRFFKERFSIQAPPKKYKPYLGPSASAEQVEEKAFENTSASKKDSYSTKRRRHHHKRPVFKTWKHKWNKYLRRRKRKTSHFISRFSRRTKKLLTTNPQPDNNKPFFARVGWLIKSYLPYSINSFSLFIIAYLTVYLIYQLTVLIVASKFHLDAVFTYYDLAFNDQSPRWNQFNIILVTGSGPFVSLIIGIVFLRYLTNLPKISKSLKLFMLWVGFHGLNLFLGAFSSGISFSEGFGYVPLWLFLNVFWQIFVALIFLAILSMTGYYKVPTILDTSYSVTRITKKNKWEFLTFQMILPWLAGGLILYLIRTPHHLPYDSANTVTIGFALIPMLLNRNATHTINYRGEKRNNRVNVLFIALLVLIVGVYRIGLNTGFYISMYYKLLFDLQITPL